jgi:sulfide:quinone oxidoreductase
MANVLILGGGFGGVIAAEQLAQRLGEEHQITLVSRSKDFIFYPALVRLAFGKCEPDDIRFDLRQAMLDRRVRFIQAEVTHVSPHRQSVTISGDDIAGELKYDYLIFALGRRLATEKIKGSFEFAHHLLSVEGAFRFGEALRVFHKGRAIIGCCPNARLPIPAYETAFALSRLLKERNERERAEITLLMPNESVAEIGGEEMIKALQHALNDHQIEFVTNFPIHEISQGAIQTADNRYLNYDLLMLVPPFRGTAVLRDEDVTDEQGFVFVDGKMRVHGVERMYAVGDCVAFSGPKMGNMAVRQAVVAAANVVFEIAAEEPKEEYNHEMRFVIDEGGKDSIYMHKEIWWEDRPEVKQGRFWHWAKRAHEHIWQARHS